MVQTVTEQIVEAVGLLCPQELSNSEVNYSYYCKYFFNMCNIAFCCIVASTVLVYLFY